MKKNSATSDTPATPGDTVDNTDIIDIAVDTESQAIQTSRKVKSTVPINLMIPRQSDSILVPPSGAREVRNDCQLLQFKLGESEKLGDELNILILGFTHAYGSIPPIKTPKQVWELFTSPNGKKPDGFIKEWFVFDDANKVVGCNPDYVNIIIDELYDRYCKEWVYLWFIPLEDYPGLKKNLLCVMPVKSGSLFGKESGFGKLVDDVSVSRNPIFLNPVKIFFTPTHERPSGGDVYGVGFQILDPSSIPDIEDTFEMVVDYFKDDSIIHFPLPEIAQAMEFRATQLEIENDLDVIEKVLRENLLATLSK